MKRGWIVACLVVGLGAAAMGVEEAPYTVVVKDGSFEVRDYDPQVVAETLVEGTADAVGNEGFRRLFRYISGANRAQGKIAMTAPVSQQQGEKIAMTAPVAEQSVDGRWAVTFMMPSGSSLETLPPPTDERVRLRAIPARRMAAVRYSGTWSRRRYEQHLLRLREWMQARGLDAEGDPVWARYNPPFTPWFLRRNEILFYINSAKASNMTRAMGSATPNAAGSP